MIKRTTAIVFVLLANLLYLAHAVVPHHHHNKLVCLGESQGLIHSNSSGHSHDNDSDNHDGKDNSDECILKELTALPSNEWKQELKFSANDYNPDDKIAFFNSSLFIGEDAFIPLILQFIPVHYINSSFSFYVSSSLGLRAPPII